MWTHCCSVNFRYKARTTEGASPYLTLGKPVINPSCGGRAGLFPFPIVDKPPDGVIEYGQPWDRGDGDTLFIYYRRVIFINF